MTIAPFEDKKAFPPAPPHFPWLQLGLACALFVLFAISDAAVLKLMDVFSPRDWGAFWVYLTAGGMCAQLGLLTIWGAIGVGRTWERQLCTMILGSIWLASWFCGSFLFGSRQFVMNSWRDAAPALCLPLLLLTTQVPLWIFRVLARWRLAYDGPAVPGRPPQMSIAGLLGATTLVGVSLGLTKLGLGLSREDQAAWWIGLSIACGSCFAAGLVILVPVSALVLRLRIWPLGSLLALLYLLGLTILVGLTTLAIMGRRGGPFDTYLALPTMFCGFAFGLLLPLVLLRLANYRLRWGRE
jgi:hypothetical protein